jgi:TfoX-like protein
MSLKDLKGLGPKTEKQLNAIGIYNKSDLEEMGAVNVFIKLGEKAATKPSLNFLYALVGAIEDKHWQEIAKHDKQRLLMELEDLKELNKSNNH